MQGFRRIRQFNFPRQIVACHASKTAENIGQTRVGHFTASFSFSLAIYSIRMNGYYMLCRNDDPSQGSKTLKQRREEERKASEASGDTRAWNSLFMRPDTVR